MVIPIPISWDEFEEISLSCLRQKWTSSNLQRHGRQGQPQAGVDIYGEDDLSRFVGVQCKLTNDSITINTVEEEIVKAEEFEPPLQVYYIATTSPRDARLQKEIRLLSKRRVDIGKFPIGILFWQDLIQELIVNEQEFNKHYPQISLKGQHNNILGTRLLSLLDISYLGLNLKYYMSMILSELGQMVGEDPLQIESMCLNVEACAVVLFDNENFKEFKSLIRQFLAYVIPYALGKEERPAGWKPANDLATSIESRILSLEYKLLGKELAAFKAGQALGRWMDLESSNTKLDTVGESKLLTYIKQLSPDMVIPDEITYLMSEYHTSDSISIVHTPHRIFNLVRSMILYQEIEREIAL